MQLPAKFLNRFKFHQNIFMILPHAAKIPVYNLSDVRQFGIDLKILIDLFLILGNQEYSLGMSEDIKHFFRRHIRIEANHFAAG